ncbi:MAG: 4Fe-4S ferredoxin [Ruminococcaceae bacterium]|nr:4Fe-4S ferredoxin [Oscillospiraceae bacterium]
MRFLSLDNLDLFFEKASEFIKIYVPVDTAGNKSSYKAWSKSTKVSKSLHTTRSAKDFFFPQTENLAEFKMSHKKIEIIDVRRDTESFAIFGVKACDARSFSILDKVYLSDPVDSFYKNRRERGLIISMTCARPSETCFCNRFGIEPSDPDGDVVFVETADGYFVKGKTKRGEDFLASISDVFEDRDSKGADEAEQKIKEVMKKLPLSDISSEAFGAGKTKDLFDREEWEKLSASCIACGTCTFVCPTCQCYDIKDFDTGHEIKRIRCWDSCMYSDFTKMAHGNIRNTQKERFRQRFMHKLVYFPENNDGLFGCVGCGRCITSCPVSMNIVKVMKEFTGEKNDQ